MSLRIRCPSCRALNTADDDERGRKIRCAECDRRISVPEEEDGGAAIQENRKLKSRSSPDIGEEEDRDRPARKKRKSSAGKGNNTMLYVIGGVLVGVLVLCGAGGIITFVVVKSMERAFEKIGANREFDVIARGPVLLDQNGNLTPNDPPDPTFVRARMKAHQVGLKADKTYVITLDSDDFDTYLRVESPQGVLLAEDDDGGGALNSRIVLRPQQAGNHRIIATSFDGGFGRYRLRVQEAD